MERREKERETELGLQGEKDEAGNLKGEGLMKVTVPLWE